MVLIIIILLIGWFIDYHEHELLREYGAYTSPMKRESLLLSI